jgi:hypothetical protein
MLAGLFLARRPPSLSSWQGRRRLCCQVVSARSKLSGRSPSESELAHRLQSIRVMKTNSPITKMSRAGRGPSDYGCTLFEMIFLLVIVASVATLVFVVALGKLKSARLQHTGLLMEQSARLVRQGLPPHPWGEGRQYAPQPASCRELLGWYGRVRTTRLVASDVWQRRLFVGCAQGPGGPRLSIYSSGPDRHLGTADDLCRPLYPELGACGLPRPQLKTAPRESAPLNPASTRWPQVGLTAVGAAAFIFWLARCAAQHRPVARPPS